MHTSVLPLPYRRGLCRHHSKLSGWSELLKKLIPKWDCFRHECGPARHCRQGARADHGWLILYITIVAFDRGQS